MSRTDAMAILKRNAIIIVFGKSRISYPLLSEKEIRAHRIGWDSANIILNASKPTLENYKEGDPAPEDYKEHCAWEPVLHLQVFIVLSTPESIPRAN